MSENIDALIWRAGEPDAWGYVLTLDALESMANTLFPGAPVTIDFDPGHVIGRLVRAWVQGNDLYATIAVDDEYAQGARDGKLAFRPGFRVASQHMDAGGVHTVDKVDISHVALTPNPMPLPGEQA